MNVITLMGSPHLDGHTASALGRFEDVLEQAGHAYERVNIVDYEVLGCMGCMSCREKPDEPGCIQVDDANDLFVKLIDADAVFYSTPLYCWGFTAQLKAFIDRHICLQTWSHGGDRSSLLADKPALLLVTSGGPEEGNADVIQTTFGRLCGFLRMSCHGKFVIGGCHDHPRESCDFCEGVPERMLAALES